MKTDDQVKVQIPTNGIGMIRLLYRGRVVGFAASLRGALSRQRTLERVFSKQGVH